MKLVYCDANLFIYLFDVHSPFYGLAEAVFRRMYLGRHHLVASLFVLGEVLVLPSRLGDTITMARIRQFFRSTDPVMAEFGDNALATFVDLRSKGIKHLDALHLAIAADARVDLFITNDHKLCKLAVPGIGRIVGLADAAALL